MQSSASGAAHRAPIRKSDYGNDVSSRSVRRLGAALRRGLARAAFDVPLGIIFGVGIGVLVGLSIGFAVTFVIAVPALWVTCCNSRRSVVASSAPVPPHCSTSSFRLHHRALVAGRWWSRPYRMLASASRWREIAYLVLACPVLGGAPVRWCSASGRSRSCSCRAPRRTSTDSPATRLISGHFARPIPVAGRSPRAVHRARAHRGTRRRPRRPSSFPQSSTVGWSAGSLATPPFRARSSASRPSRSKPRRSGRQRRVRASPHRTAICTTAQQRLVALAMDLGQARERFDSDPERPAARRPNAHEEAKAALVELRDLARGIHPAVLAERGLGTPRSRRVVARCPVPVALAVDLPAPPAACKRWRAPRTSSSPKRSPMSRSMRRRRAAAVSVSRRGDQVDDPRRRRRDRRHERVGEEAASQGCASV